MERMNSYQVSRDSTKHYLYFSMISHILITMIMIDFSINIIVIRYTNGWINTIFNLYSFHLYMILLELILKNKL